MDLEKEIQELKHNLEVQKTVNRLLFTGVIKAIDSLSPKADVFEVLEKIFKGQKEKFNGANPIVDEAFQQVLRIVSKTKSNQE